MAGEDLVTTLGVDESAAKAGFDRAARDSGKFAQVVESNVKKATVGFTGAFKGSFNQVGFMLQDFAVVMGQGGANSFGRAMMSASNNIGMLGMAMGPWGMAAATGASILSATLLPAIMNAADGTKALTDQIGRFLEKSNNIGKNVNLRRGFARQLEDIIREGGGGLDGVVRSIGRDREDIKEEMDKLEGQFNTSGKIIESFTEGRQRIKDEASQQIQILGDAGDLDAIDRVVKEREQKLEALAQLQNTIFRLQPEELKKRFPGQDIAPLLDMQKEWGKLSDKIKEVEAAEENAKAAMNRPFPPLDVGAHTRFSMEAAQAEIRHMNRFGFGPGNVPGFGPMGGGEVRAIGQNSPGRRPDRPRAGGAWMNVFRPEWANVDNALPHRADRRGKANEKFDEDWQDVVDAARGRAPKDESKLSGLAQQQVDEQRKTNDLLRAKGAGPELKIKRIPGR